MSDISDNMATLQLFAKEKWVARGAIPGNGKADHQLDNLELERVQQYNPIITLSTLMNSHRDKHLRSPEPIRMSSSNLSVRSKLSWWDFAQALTDWTLECSGSSSWHPYQPATVIWTIWKWNSEKYSAVMSLPSTSRSCEASCQWVQSENVVRIMCWLPPFYLHLLYVYHSVIIWLKILKVHAGDWIKTFTLLKK